MVPVVPRLGPELRFALPRLGPELRFVPGPRDEPVPESNDMLENKV